MTDIEFHVNVPDKLHYSCRLLRKAYRSGAQTVVTAEPELLQEFDKLLWRYSLTEFLPHCRGDSSLQTLAATPIWLTDHLNVCPADKVLINLGQAVPADFGRFERLIEIASLEEGDLLAARDRWKYYKGRGYPLKRHELPASPELV